LFDYVASVPERQKLAWDCATGNGQAAAELALRFEAVVATDASAEQIAAATPVEGVDFRVARAEQSDLDAESADLVTVAQALHWFDIDAFFAEAFRVLRPHGALAYWCYGNCEIDGDACDDIVTAAYRHVDRYWPSERLVVERGYRDIEPPAPPIDVPRFSMTLDWDASQMLAYIETWSACQRYREATGEDPLAHYREGLEASWGDGARTVRWPLFLTVCRRPPAAA